MLLKRYKNRLKALDETLCEIDKKKVDISEFK